jgi:hypothetical protein
MSMNSTERATLSWQQRLLPFMMKSIIFVALFFLIASFLQLFYLYQEIRVAPNNDVQAALSSYELQSKLDIDYIRWKSTLLLEKDVIQHRYQQVNTALLLRAWTRYLGFLTGMILAFIGSVFILGKLREEAMQINGEAEGVKASLNTSSPGIVLAVLGVLLMCLTIAIPFQFETRDVPVYLKYVLSTSDTSLPEPKGLDCTPIPLPPGCSQQNSATQPNTPAPK